MVLNSITMDANLVECDLSEREGVCMCRGGPSLEILTDVQRAYEGKMELIERTGGPKKLQMQVDVLRSWVSDLVGQNTLLARVVEELEMEATSRLLSERRRHSEIACELQAEAHALRRRLARKDADLGGLLEVLRRLRDSDYCTLDGIHFFERDKKKDRCEKFNELKILNDTLHKENLAKEREIRRLTLDAQQYEETITKLRSEISTNKYHTSNLSKIDVEVATEVQNECIDEQPAKDYSGMLRDDVVKYQERLQKMELNLKSSSESVRDLRKVNVALSEELHALRRVCLALDEQCRTASVNAQFKDDIIKEMRRQLKQAKAKPSCPCEVITSTPNGSQEELRINADSHEISVIDRSVSPVLVSDESKALENSQKLLVQESFLKNCSKHERCICYKGTEAIAKGMEYEKNLEELYFNKKVEKDAAECVEEQTVKEGCSQKYETATDSRTLQPVIKQVSSTNIATTLHESICASSAAGSGASDAAARAQHYHNKLLATLQILRNKEETVRVQSESLAVAEARIASLTVRVAQLRRERNKTAQELRALRQSTNSSGIEKTEVSTAAQTQEKETHKRVVNTLQDNLSVIEELYTECFYEAAKQEELIEMLRKSYLDVRLMDKEKSDQIGKLQNVVNAQKWSLEKCQGIAIEVEKLKMDILSFLNNSNNDSGMWERSEDSFATEVGEELHEIMQQLMQLRELLAGDCTCGFREENTRLKQKNEFMEKQVGDLRQKVCDLETTLMDRDTRDQEYREHIDLREKELDNIRQQLAAVEEKCTDQSNTCDSLRLQLQQTQVLLNDKTTELFEVQQQRQSLELTVKDLNEELNKAEKIIQENSRVRAEVSCLTQQVAMWRSRLTDSEARVNALEQQLRLAQTHCQELDECYRQKSERALALQAQLGAAQARGAALCDESHRVVCAVRHWVRRMRDKHREQQEKLKEQETIIQSLRQHLGGDEDKVSMKEDAPCCSRRLSKSEARQRERSCVRASGTSSCSKCSRSERVEGTSEMASCSSAPVPPRRWRTKLPPCGDKRCRWSGVRDAGVQEPVSSEAGTDPPSLRDVCFRRGARPHPDTIARAASPSVELFERVERLHEAWLAGPRRWSRSGLYPDTQ